MTIIQHYGDEAESEKLAEEKKVCRQILSEINKFGINQRQQFFLIYLLSLELEDIDSMRTITTTIRNLNQSAFISQPDQTESV